MAITYILIILMCNEEKILNSIQTDDYLDNIKCY